MSSIFVKLDQSSQSYLCSWDSKDEALTIMCQGAILKKYEKLSFSEAWDKIGRFQQKHERKTK